jgi:glycosyltransferase involved in cell wall biosynthesis
VKNRESPNEEQPLVSIVIPTYNRSAFLERAILSVQKQTYTNLEIIVIDDASKDATKDIINSFNDNRLRYIKHFTNRGGAAARNTGISASRGEYVAFLDDDDEWVESKIESQLKDILEYDGVLCSAFIVGKKEGVKRYRKGVVDAKDLRKGFIFSGGANIIFVRSKILKKVSFDESLNEGEDWDLLIRLASEFSIRYTDKRLVIYHNENHHRISNRALTMSLEEINNNNTLKVIQKHKDFFGPYWHRYHIARRLLAYIGRRDKKLAYIRYAANRCGLMPVLNVFADKVLAQLKRTYA